MATIPVQVEGEKPSLIHPHPAEDAAKPKPMLGPPVDEDALLKGWKLWTTFGVMMLALFCIALDQTILATALPSIGSDFDSYSLQGWVASAFVLTQTASIIIFGALCRIHKAKWILLGSLFVFEVGSLIAGVAPNVDVLIFGRAVSGVGAAGMMGSMISILAQISTLEQRPKLMGLFGAVFGISSVIGPLLGGVLTDNATWRWVFYLNLPVGGVAGFFVFLLLKPSVPMGWKGGDRSRRALWQATLRLDWFGALLYFGATVLVVLAFQWAGGQKPWSDPAVISCLVLGIVLYGAFILFERWMGDRALIPGSIMKSFSIYAILVFAFFTRFAFLLAVYYIPLFYQAAKNESATKSAVNMFPLVIFVVVTAAVGGQLISRVFHCYWHFLLLGPVFQAIAGGLLYTINASTSDGKVIGFQILLGVGVGFVLQNSNLAMQAEFNDQRHLIAQSSSLAMAFQLLGGTLALAIGQTAFSTQLGENLSKYAPSVDKTLIMDDPLAIFNLPSDQIPGTVQAYTDSLDIVYILIPAVSGVSLIAALFIKNIRISAPKAPAAAKKGSSELEKGASTESIEVGETPILKAPSSVGSVEEKI